MSRAIGNISAVSIKTRILTIDDQFDFCRPLASNIPHMSLAVSYSTMEFEKTCLIIHMHAFTF